MESENPPSQESSTRTVADGKDDKPTGPEPSSPAGQTPETPQTSAPDIMSRLPKSRPQRANDRRRAAARGTVKSTPRARATGAASTAPARSQAKRASRAATSRAPAKSAAQASKRPAATRARPAPAPPAARSETTAETAPSLPRLAWDGATEAAKLPIKVSGRLTLRALDAVARGLRGR